MEKDIRDEKWFKKYVKSTLKAIAVGSSWVVEFALFEKTGKKEVTLKVRITGPHVDTAECIERVKKIVEEMGWVFKVAPDVKDAGEVSR